MITLNEDLVKMLDVAIEICGQTMGTGDCKLPVSSLVSWLQGAGLAWSPSSPTGGP